MQAARLYPKHCCFHDTHSSSSYFANHNRNARVQIAGDNFGHPAISNSRGYRVRRKHLVRRRLPFNLRQPIAGFARFHA